MTGTTALVGYGRFGRALAELMADAGMEVRAWDPSAAVPARLRAASPVELVSGAERVVLCVPVSAVRDAAASLKPLLAPEQLVLDVASVKSAPVRDLADVLGGAIPWAATHPLFGPTSIALEERPFAVVVCPNALHPSAASRARAYWEALGCEVMEQDAEGHDRLMAGTHALAFFVAKGLMDVGAGADLPFTPPSFQAMAHTIEAVRSDASHLFYTIQNDNPFAADARARLLAALADIHARLGSGAPGSAPEGAPLTIPDLGDRAPDLMETRELIDDTDRALVRILARREQLVRRAGRAKALAGQPIRDPRRERELRAERRRWAAEQGLDPEAIDEIFREILRYSRGVQRQRRREGEG
jgi:prephenate dehydrogenase